MAISIASTRYAYTQRDGQTELAWVAWLDTKTHECTVTHSSTNRARRRVTFLMRLMMLPPSQTATYCVYRHVHISYDRMLLNSL